MTSGFNSIAEIRAAQLAKLQVMTATLLSSNRFYQAKLAAAGISDARDLTSVDDLRAVPWTTKVELSNAQANDPPFGGLLSYPERDYILLHQTSGTTGKSLQWLDTRESWDWWARCWAEVYGAAGVTQEDRVFVAFSFGPFIGFWSAYAGATAYGALVHPGGGMSTARRLQAIIDNKITVLVSTPTYALHMAEVAAEMGIDIASSDVRLTLHAGEPGANIPATRARIENAWGARCIDHAGATEVGAWGFQCEAGGGLHINENEFIYEVIDPVTGSAASEGELVLTNLGRVAMPVVRYRTGDHVRIASSPCSCGRSFVKLEGGILGRVDDCMIIRGVNVFPSAIENIIRGFPEVSEFAVEVRQRGSMDEMEIRYESTAATASAVIPALGERIQTLLGLRAHIVQAPDGSLPRPELKARRFTDHRKA